LRNLTKCNIHHAKQIKRTSWCATINVIVSKLCNCKYHIKACSITPSNGACNNKKNTYAHTYIHTHTHTHTVHNVSNFFLKNMNFRHPSKIAPYKQRTIRKAESVTGVTDWTTRKSGFDFRQGEETIFFATVSREALTPTQPPVQRQN
jgi:hypothetical protein